MTKGQLISVLNSQFEDTRTKIEILDFFLLTTPEIVLNLVDGTSKSDWGLVRMALHKYKNRLRMLDIEDVWKEVERAEVFLKDARPQGERVHGVISKIDVMSQNLLIIAEHAKKDLEKSAS